MSNIRRQFHFHKSEVVPITLELDSHIIESSVLPKINGGDLLTAYGIHRKNLGPTNIRNKSYLEIFQEIKNIKNGSYMCLEALCNPTEDFIENPDLLVSFMRF